MSTLADKIARLLVYTATIIGIGILVFTFSVLIKHGWYIIDWKFLTAAWQHRDIEAGGIFPAILGSLYLGIGILLLSVPLGICTAVYLTEYSKHPQWRRILQMTIRNLAGVPSIVYGLFGLSLFVHMLNLGTSLLAAAATLSAMTLPWIITASVEALNAVPKDIRESSLALGSTKWQTIHKVILPMAIPGAITGSIVGVARALGETAPIILVGATFYLTQLPNSPLDKFMALPYHTFILATQHAHSEALGYASATALVLIGLTFILSLSAIILRWRIRTKLYR